MKKLKKDAVEIARAIALTIDNEATVTIWQNRRLYVNYCGMPKSAQQGGYIDISTGNVSQPYKARTGFQKQVNAAIAKIASDIFE